MSSGLAGLEALARLFPMALSDTGHARRVADFLLAWHNAAENGGWDPVDLWNVDDAITEDMLAVLQLLHTEPQISGRSGLPSRNQSRLEALAFRSAGIPSGGPEGAER